MTSLFNQSRGKPSSRRYHYRLDLYVSINDHSKIPGQAMTILYFTNKLIKFSTIF